MPRVSFGFAAPEEVTQWVMVDTRMGRRYSSELKISPDAISYGGHSFHMIDIVSVHLDHEDPCRLNIKFSNRARHKAFFFISADACDAAAAYINQKWQDATAASGSDASAGGSSRCSGSGAAPGGILRGNGCNGVGRPGQRRARGAPELGEHQPGRSLSADGDLAPWLNEHRLEVRAGVAKLAGGDTHPHQGAHPHPHTYPHSHMHAHPTRTHPHAHTHSHARARTHTHARTRTLKHTHSHAHTTLLTLHR